MHAYTHTQLSKARVFPSVARTLLIKFFEIVIKKELFFLKALFLD